MTSPHELLDRIVVDPAVCGGRPCVRGHRSWVTVILDLLASGMSAAEVMEEYPQLTRDDVLACIAYASERTRGRLVHVA